MRTAALILLALATSARAGHNVLLIIAGDYGVDSNSLHHSTAGATAPTPRTAALAAIGVRFTQVCAYPGLHAYRTPWLPHRRGECGLGCRGQFTDDRRAHLAEGHFSN